MKRFFLLLLSGILLFPGQAFAHFGMLIPSSATVTEKGQSDLSLEIAFSHPFSGKGMDMKRPEQFFVLTSGGKTDLLSTLAPAQFMDHAAWRSSFKIGRPDVYQFAVSPQPYYEESEDSFIIHYAKTVVAAFGEEEGWHVPCGLPLEIVPLSRPFANYAGNLFQGTALLNGKPLAGAIVEVENLNRNGLHVAPNEYFETQTVRTDVNGNFSFAVPWPGWWGFAVLCESPEKMEHGGTMKDVELGGVIWVYFEEPQDAKKTAHKAD